MEWPELLDAVLSGAQKGSIPKLLAKAAWGANPPEALRLSGSDNSSSQICGKIFKAVSSANDTLSKLLFSVGSC